MIDSARKNTYSGSVSNGSRPPAHDDTFDDLEPLCPETCYTEAPDTAGITGLNLELSAMEIYADDPATWPENIDPETHANLTGMTPRELFEEGVTAIKNRAEKRRENAEKAKELAKLASERAARRAIEAEIDWKRRMREEDSEDQEDEGGIPITPQQHAPGLGDAVLLHYMDKDNRCFPNVVSLGWERGNPKLYASSQVYASKSDPTHIPLWEGPTASIDDLNDDLNVDVPDKAKVDIELCEERWTHSFLRSLVMLHENPEAYEVWLEKVACSQLEDPSKIHEWSQLFYRLTQMEPTAGGRADKASRDQVKADRQQQVQSGHVASDEPSEEPARSKDDSQSNDAEYDDMNPPLLMIFDRAVEESKTQKTSAMFLFAKEAESLVRGIESLWNAGTSMITRGDISQVVHSSMKRVKESRPDRYTHGSGSDSLSSLVINLPRRKGIVYPPSISIKISPHTDWTPKCNTVSKLPRAWSWLWEELKSQYYSMLAPLPDENTKRVRTPQRFDKDEGEPSRVKRTRTGRGY